MTCDICKGARFIQVDLNTVKMCVCAYAHALRVHLGPEISGAKTIHSSPLLDPSRNDKGLPTVDLTSSNVMIRGSWPQVLSHLKWSLGYKGTTFRFRVVTDENLLMVWLGKESYLARPKKTRDDKESFNNLGDFIGEDIDLVIVRLGFLGYANKAMPGVLKESLLLREGIRKPTWVIEDVSNPFADTLSYSPEAAEFLKSRYLSVSLDPAPGTGVSTVVGFSAKSALPYDILKESEGSSLHVDMDLAGFSSTSRAKGGGSIGRPARKQQAHPPSEGSVRDTSEGSNILGSDAPRKNQRKYKNNW